MIKTTLSIIKDRLIISSQTGKDSNSLLMALYTTANLITDKDMEKAVKYYQTVQHTKAIFTKM